MSRKLELVREAKLFRLLPGRKESSRLEASGVALVDDTTALVVFDNLNQVAAHRPLAQAPERQSAHARAEPGIGFRRHRRSTTKDGRVFCLIECAGGRRRDPPRLRRRVRLAEAVPSLHPAATRDSRKANKGFEGLAHVWRGDREHLYALREGNHGKGAKHGGGRVDVFVRARDGGWKASHRDPAAERRRSSRTMPRSRIATGRLPSSRRRRRACGSPGSMRRLVPSCRDRHAIYRFPSKSYGNVEGIAWLTRDTLVAVSDRKKSQQPGPLRRKGPVDPRVPDPGGDCKFAVEGDMARSRQLRSRVPAHR